MDVKNVILANQWDIIRKMVCNAKDRCENTEGGGDLSMILDGVEQICYDRYCLYQKKVK